MQVVCGASPFLPLQRMMTEPLRVQREAAGARVFHGSQRAGVQGAAPVVQQAPIRYFLSQRVLERVDWLGEEARLVQELGCLEVHETPPKVLLAHLGDGLEGAVRHVLPKNRRRLKELLLL